MMKMQDQENTLLWLMKPEDSSSWEAKRVAGCPCQKSRRVMFGSMAKFFVWYATALSIGILLSKLH